MSYQIKTLHDRIIVYVGSEILWRGSGFDQIIETDNADLALWCNGQCLYVGQQVDLFHLQDTFVSFELTVDHKPYICGNRYIYLILEYVMIPISAHDGSCDPYKLYYSGQVRGICYDATKLHSGGSPPVIEPSPLYAPVILNPCVLTINPKIRSQVCV